MHKKTACPERSRRGFTLIEMMVVVFIIGLLASIVTISVNNSRMRGRDAKRKADLDSIRTAIELYGDMNHTYHLPNTADGCINAANGAAPTVPLTTALMNAQLLSSVPRDPQEGTTCSTTDRVYRFRNWGGTTGYCLYAHLNLPTTNAASNGWDTASSGNLANDSSGWGPTSAFLMNYRVGNDCH